MSDQRARGRVKRAFLTSIRKILESIFNDRADWYDNNRARIVIEEPAISRVRNASRADRTALSRELSPIDDLCACYVTASRRHLQRFENRSGMINSVGRNNPNDGRFLPPRFKRCEIQR